MSNGLVIVESPAKIKTIRKYLGSEYNIMASVGHVKDLPKSILGIDLKNDFSPTYEIIEAKKKVIADLKKAAKNASSIYLAPDPDREGEAIAWHIASELEGKGRRIYRVLFNDLSRGTVQKALANPLELNFNKYEAQQTRRILDRLVGYKISPLLWEKVKRGLSAGRVQSVAVRLICDREEEINAFLPEEYWNITATLDAPAPPRFDAKLIKIDGKKAKVVNADQSEDLLARINKGPFIVVKLEKKEVKKSPPPPFTTSKLQQEASRWLRFSPAKTMRVAQKLYEGIEVGAEGQVGLITYMRTDSVRISEDALLAARDFIAETYGPAYLPPKARFFKNQGSAQDAHEAIRPTGMSYQPKDIKTHLTPDQFKLYQLIWNRFIACQINPAIFDQTTIDIAVADCLFRAIGQVLKFPGYTAVYTEAKEDNGEENGLGTMLPALTEGETLTLVSLKSEQRFTQPPPRFTEATLVRELEDKGIGRPSTYAAILSTIQDREYVILEQARFKPTELGTMVNDQLKANFPQIMDVAFTAGMEKKLDLIEEGELKRLATLQEFYATFSQDLEKAKVGMKNLKKEATPTDELCELCQSPMVIKWGRWGRFVACSNYPNCKNRKNLAKAENGPAELPQLTDIICEKCGKNMAVKKGRFGDFIGCSGYPECKNILSVSTGVNCPQSGCDGYLTQKRSKGGKVFYSCSRYPACKFAIWDRPVPEPCPKCQAPFLVEKKRRGGESYLGCSRKECGYKGV
ncbi:MAG: type I DNA topoisomerase [Smithellaceae bacterium]|nr:type I DNA topoisomerase [Smithellaceae bacterium]